MRKWTLAGRAAVIGMLFAISFALLIFINAATTINSDAPAPERGLLDLSGWDFASQGLVKLNGEWEFYEGQLLEPSDFRSGYLSGSSAASGGASYIQVPGTWRGKTESGGVPRKGTGTYRLTIQLPESDSVYGLKVSNIRMSHRIYVNGKLVGGSGSPSSASGTTQPANTPHTVIFPVNGNEMELLIQTANFHFVTGGIAGPIVFGSYEELTVLNMIRVGTDIAILILLAMFGTYHLTLYLMGRHDRVYLLSGGYMLVLMLSYSLFNEKLFQRLLPAIPFELTYKLLEFGQFVSGIVFMLFLLQAEPRLISKRRLHLMVSPLYAYLVSVVLLPYAVHTEVKYFFTLYLFALMCIFIGRLVWLFVKCESGTYARKELALFIGTCVSLTVYFAISCLYAESLMQSDMAAKYAVTIFICILQILLAMRFTNAFRESEVLSEKLAASNQLKDEFLLNTSHELKTPLHGIMSMATNLLENEDDPLTSKQRRNVSLIKDTSVKLSMLVHDLIDVTRLKHGELRLFPTTVDVRVAVGIVFDLLRFELGGKSVHLDNQVGANIYVTADEIRLRQVLYNLVHNAIKFTDSGVIQVAAVQEGNETVITVEDTGVGIPADKHSAIFDLFEQIYNPHPSDGYAGMGVGLYISRKLIQQMGGDIRVDWSEVGSGTRMRFTLPRAEWLQGGRETASASDQSRDDSDEDVLLDVTGRQAHTILIVDDEASNIRVLMQLLERKQYNVILAFSAKEALEKLQLHPEIDLMILDVMMPGMSGIELCQKLRTRYSILDLPILFATVKDSVQDIVLGFQAGANDYVTKPFNGETLIARIQTLLAMKTSIHEAVRNELAFHQAQIKPHFLYNALSSVISFCYTDGEKAAHLLSMLSQYLRYLLDMEHSKLFVPLERELELIYAYVEIEKARFGDRFQFRCEMDETIRHAEIPSLCIQPFVENAIRHGLFEKEDSGTVSLSIRERDKHIQITIEDDGVGIPDDRLYELTVGEGRKGGIGIFNIKRRLSSMEGATLTIHSELGRGTTVNVYIPIMDPLTG